MGTIDYKGFVGSSYAMDNYVPDREELFNYYFRQVESPFGKVQSTLCPTPGLALLATLPNGPGRGILTQNNRTFAVGGPSACEIAFTTPIVVSTLGVMSQDANPATLATNGDAGHQVFWTSGGFGYICDTISTVFSQELTGATFGAYLDGYFLALDAVTSTLKWSALLDGTSWDSLDILQRSTSGDRWVAMVVADRQIWLLGSQSSDVYANTGDADNPFAIIDGASIQSGIRAPFSLQLLGGKPVWLGASTEGDGIVLLARDGYNPTRISNHAVEEAIQGYAVIADAVAFTYQDQGHAFYVLTFPTQGVTWVYDDRLGPQLGWHRRGEWDAEIGEYAAYRPEFHAFPAGQHIVLDREDGSIYDMSVTNPLEADGTGIRRTRRAPYVWNHQDNVRFFRLELLFKPGGGTGSGQGADPTVMMRYSDDGGQTWGNERHASTGTVGRYETRIEFYQLGMGRNRVFEISVTDPALALGQLSGAILDVDGGVH